MGDSYQSLQDYLQAIRNYQKALSIDPNNAAARKGILAAEATEDAAWAKKAAEREAEKAKLAIAEAFYSTYPNMTLGSITWAATNVDGLGIFAPRPDMYTQPYRWDSNPCPSGWRVPTQEEFKMLTYSGRSWAKVGARGNAVAGMFYGPQHEICMLPNNMTGCIFLPAFTYRNRANGMLSTQGSTGIYWSSTQYDSTNGYNLRFSSENCYSNNLNDKTSRLTIRCVQ